jgi:hypothetical protein
VPYPFAHPAAVLPLARPLGRFAVPSALAIGSIVPDLWYFVPFVSRADSHGAAALLWFCLPAGLLAYALFHLLLKQPLIALLSPRLAGFTCAGLPAAPWRAVIVSLLAGALTHLVWDGLTHSNDHPLHGHNWLQHASTVLGSAILAGWVWRKLRRAPVAAAAAQLSTSARACTLLALAGAMAISALWSAESAPLDLPGVRQLLRTAGMASVEALGTALLVYCALWHLRGKIP